MKEDRVVTESDTMNRDHRKITADFHSTPSDIDNHGIEEEASGTNIVTEPVITK